MQILTKAFGPVFTNSYLLVADGEAVWIDPAPSSASWIDASLPLDIRPKAIVLTHTHWDHICDLGRSKRFANLPIYLHPLDAPNLKHPGSDGLPWPEELSFPDRGTSLLHFLEEGMVWTLGSLSFETLHTPGHSPGSLVFLCKEESLLVSGDTLFARGWGRTDLPHSNPTAMRLSLRRVAKLPKESLLLPGHGDSSRLETATWLATVLEEESWWSLKPKTLSS